MNDTHTTTDPQAGDVVEPQAGTAQSQADTPTPAQEAAGDTPDQTTPTADEVKALRAEAAKYRKQLRDFQKKFEQLEAERRAKEEAELSEAEKAARRAEELEAQLNAERDNARRILTENAVIAAASRLGYANPEDAVALLPRDAIEWDDDGRPDTATVNTAVEQLLKQRPYLRAGHTAGGSPTNPARGHQQGETDEQRRARLFGGARGGGIFDPASAASRGGGVVMPPTS